MTRLEFLSHIIIQKLIRENANFNDLSEYQRINMFQDVYDKIIDINIR